MTRGQLDAPSRCTFDIVAPVAASRHDLRQQLLAVADPEQDARHPALIVALESKSGVRVRQDELGRPKSAA